MKETREQLEIKIDNLENVIQDIFWMARRYAHGRHTYAPSMVRGVYKIIKKYDINIKKDDTIKPPKKSELQGISLRGDYLDDINI